MVTDYATSREAADPFCLRAGEAAALLAGHPWHRFVVLGDSVAAGVGDLVDGYSPLPWADRIAAELAERQPGLVYRNLGRRNLRAAAVRTGQLAEGLAVEPDLALVAAGAADCMSSRYDPDAVDAELVAMISALRSAGADVLTVGVLILEGYPGVPQEHRGPLAQRLRLLGRHTAALAARLGTLHLDLTAHPAGTTPGMHSDDGMHGNGITQAISAAEAIRRLGAHLGNTFAASPAAARQT